MAYRGRYNPKNPKKYVGDASGIVYRSSLELTLMKVFDEHPDIVAWSSEEVVVPYVCPTDGKRHRYFPDFVIKKKHNKPPNDSQQESHSVVMIEVKPSQQCREPKTPKRKTRRYLNEVLTWGKNQAKWNAAAEYCLRRGWEWKIMTEKDIRGGSNKSRSQGTT
ncbi:MAG: hypothetical protein DDT26_00663 [Dehalococcoidia bacterium]|nr:hypothetical protein [Chloroflexota bacterium]